MPLVLRRFYRCAEDVLFPDAVIDKLIGDLGDAFVGNIGQRALYDFTAVGDVVNTASRVQAQAGGGEVVFSQRVAEALPAPTPNRVELELKGKPEPEVAYRLKV